MSVKIRLQRHGKKGKPFYWIVVADARAKRDGKYLEKIGVYNPNANPAAIDLNIDKAVQWLQNGAQPTDTARNLLSYKGVMFKNHLIGGIRKGALTQEQADAKFATWLEEKATKISDKEAGLSKAESDEKATAFAAEKSVNEARIEAAKSVIQEVVEVVEKVEAVAEEVPETIDEAAAKAAE